MERIRQWTGFLLVAACVLALPQAAELAETADLAASVFGATKCADGRDPVGSLGIAGLKCNCTMATTKTGVSPRWRFRSEPRILKLDPEGPARDKLEPGDTIVAIDGHLITTAQGGRLFSDPPVAQPLPLTIRRAGRELHLAIEPVPVCPEPVAPPAPAVPRPDVPQRPAPPAPPAMPELAVPAVRPAPVPRPDRAVLAAPAPPAPPDLATMPLVPGGSLMPRGWTGMGLTCGGCSIHKGQDASVARWRFETPPEVYSVDPGGPADRAGLARGDVLTHIDGQRLDSDEGAESFSAILPGQKVIWTIRRAGRTVTRAMTAGDPPRPAVPAPEAPPAVKAGAVHLRYAGRLGDTAVEVRGPGHVVVSASRQGDELVIVTGDAVIRLWQDADPEEGS